VTREIHVRSVRELLSGVRAPQRHDVESLECVIIESSGTLSDGDIDPSSLARITHQTFRTLTLREGADVDALRQDWGRLAWHLVMHAPTTAAILEAATCALDDPGPKWPYDGMGAQLVLMMAYPRAVERAESFADLRLLMRDHLAEPRVQSLPLPTTVDDAVRDAIALAQDEADLDELIVLRKACAPGIDRDLTEMIENKRKSFRALAARCDCDS